MMFFVKAVTSRSGRMFCCLCFSLQTHESALPHHSIKSEVKDRTGSEILPGLLKTILHFLAIIFKGAGFYG